MEDAVLLRALVRMIAKEVAAEVLANFAPATSHYGTSKAAALPPGKSRAWALRTLKTVPGARKVGRDWVVAVADFDAWLSEQDAARLSGKSHGDPRQTAANDVEALAAEALDASGFRRARAAAR